MLWRGARDWPVFLDGRSMIVTLENAASAETQSLEFNDDPTAPLGLTLKFTGHYAEGTPRQVPLTIVISE